MIWKTAWFDGGGSGWLGTASLGDGFHEAFQRASPFRIGKLRELHLIGFSRKFNQQRPLPP